MFFKHKKFISFLLILCTVFSMCSQFLTVFAVDGKHTMPENDVRVYFPTNVSDGISCQRVNKYTLLVGRGNFYEDFSTQTEQA